MAKIMSFSKGGCEAAVYNMWNMLSRVWRVNSRERWGDSLPFGHYALGGHGGGWPWMLFPFLTSQGLLGSLLRPTLSVLSPGTWSMVIARPPQAISDYSLR